MTPLGAVFTPQAWARWGLDRLDAPARVAAGARFCDPTAGEGVFAEALAEAWAGPSGAFDRAWARRITLVDREGAFLEAFARRWRQRWGWAFPEAGLVEADAVTAPAPGTFELIAGNPPWITYPDLPPADQDRYRPWFSAQGLVGPAQRLLLGASRLDLAALVTDRVLAHWGTPGARAGFFLPLSLFHNEGTPGPWRRRWPPEAVFDLTGARPFPGVATRCGWAEFAPGSPGAPGRPIPYWTGAPGAFDEARAVADSPGGPLRVLGPGADPGVPTLEIEAWQRPRQGLNTGGLNGAYHVAGPPAGVDPAFVHPLAGRDRWILVPYDRQGRLLDEVGLEASGLARFWAPWKDRLAARKGILLGSSLARGRWWALLGAGPYAFTPYKVLWSAYGRRRLDAQVWGPRDDGALWQADQALQAYIPCHDEADANRIAEFLRGEAVAAYLEGSRSAGTRSWAQPGRFKALWRFRPGSETRAGTSGS